MTADLSYWDRQFKFSAILPDFADCLATMEQDSARATDSLSLTRLEYGPDARHWVELSSGDAGDLVPVFIHGGYWRALRAEDHRLVLSGLGALAPVAANLEYRLMPSVRMKDLVSDVALGLRVLVEHLGAGKKVILIGHSAGAHLARAALRSPDLSECVAAMIGLSGIYDLQPVTWSFLQHELNLSKEEVSEWSVHADINNVPTLLCVGQNETGEFHRQAHVCSSYTGASVLEAPGTHHMTILNALADPDSSLVRQLHIWISGFGANSYQAGGDP